MFFKKQNKPKTEKNSALDYFMYRDSLTGQMNRAFAIKEFERLKKCIGYGGVMVHIINADNLPLYKANIYIPKTAQLIASISESEVSRIEDGYFVVFSDKCEQLAQKLGFFMSEFCRGEEMCGVGMELFDEHEKDFDLFIKRLKRCTQVAVNVVFTQVAKDLPII